MLVQPAENKLNKNPLILKILGGGKTYFVKTPWWLKKIYPKRVWDVDTKEKIIYLTFDDGPHPVATPFVLDELKKYNAKASFFCIGKNVLTYPELYKRILAEGHRVANHSHSHMNGYKTPDAEYLADIHEAAACIDSRLFRPPYGRMTASQFKKLPGYKVVMWDVLSGDFDETLSKEKCLEVVLAKTKQGSIVVFHENDRAWEKMSYALPRVLAHYQKEGYNFSVIP